MDNIEKKIRVLFFHNTLPEYRIGWFEKLSELSEIKFIFTNEKQNMKDYGISIDYNKSEKLNKVFLSDGLKGLKELANICKVIDNYDFVELPPIDTFKEFIYSVLILFSCKKNNVKIGYFWEKWEAPKEVQPIKRRLKNKILQIVPKMVYKHSNIIFATGRKSKEYFILNGINEDKIFIIPDCSETPDVEFVDIRKKHKIDKDKKIVMFLGRLLKQKGVKYLIEAYSLIEEKYENKTHLLIAGDGEDLENCKILAKDKNIKNITFAGKVLPKDRGNYFSQCDIFVYPVTYINGTVDVWGLTLNEALQHKKILIATYAVGSAYELINNGENGFIIEPENIKELSLAMEKSLNNEMIKKSISVDTEKYKKYCYDSMAKEYIDIVRKCLEIAKR